jgi:hypothetical protein
MKFIIFDTSFIMRFVQYNFYNSFLFHDLFVFQVDICWPLVVLMIVVPWGLVTCLHYKLMVYQSYCPARVRVTMVTLFFSLFSISFSIPIICQTIMSLILPSHGWPADLGTLHGFPRIPNSQG